MLRRADSGLMLCKLIAKELPLQQHMLWVAIVRSFKRRLPAMSARKRAASASRRHIR
jgi:hypothetical protein